MKVSTFIRTMYLNGLFIRKGRGVSLDSVVVFKWFIYKKGT